MTKVNIKRDVLKMMSENYITNNYIKLKMFYENVLSFNKYLELRMFSSTDIIRSLYFSVSKPLLNQLQTLHPSKTNNKYNIYVSTNPHKVTDRKLDSITGLRNVVFDVESIGTKKVLYDDNDKPTEYMNQLVETVYAMKDHLQDKHGLYITAIVVSGRGLHVYVTLNDNEMVTDSKKYKRAYRDWYKKLTKHFNESDSMPHKGIIKCDDMCHDWTRIFGAPGTINVKYAEQPVRDLLYLNVNVIDNNSIIKELNKFVKDNVVKDKKRAANKRKYSKYNNKYKYDNESIFDSPEFRVFEHNPEPGTMINNRLRFTLKLLMFRDGCTNFEEVSDRISDLGYPYKDMSYNASEYAQYDYSEQVLNNYVLDNFEWAVDNNFKLPYRLIEENISRLHSRHIEVRNDVFVAPSELQPQEINNYKDLIKFVNEFNKVFTSPEGTKILMYPKALESNIYKRIKNKKLIEFINQNNLINRVIYYYQ